jgi:hypothetical protein
MKTFLFTLIFALSTIIVFPQDYHKLIRTNVLWDQYVVYFPVTWCYTGAKRIYFTDQDTLINGLTYRISKLQNIITLRPNGEFCPPLAVEQATNNTYEFLREDTIAKKVFIYTPGINGGKDELFYDFSMNPGDTLNSSYYLDQNHVFILDSIGTFYLNNGESRRIFWFQSDSPVYYIESIGNMEGLFYPLPMGFTESGGGYLCVSENSVNLLGNVCSNYYVGQSEIRIQDPGVFPNPATDHIYIDISSDYVLSVFHLFNSQGIEVKTMELSIGRNSMQVANLSRGIYHYAIQLNKILKQGKIILL